MIGIYAGLEKCADKAQCSLDAVIVRPTKVDPREAGGLHGIVVVVPKTKAVGRIGVLTLWVGCPGKVRVGKEIGVVAPGRNAF